MLQVFQITNPHLLSCTLYCENDAINSALMHTIISSWTFYSILPDCWWLGWINSSLSCCKGEQIRQLYLVVFPVLLKSLLIFFLNDKIKKEGQVHGYLNHQGTPGLPQSPAHKNAFENPFSQKPIQYVTNWLFVSVVWILWEPFRHWLIKGFFDVSSSQILTHYINVNQAIFKKKHLGTQKLRWKI